MTMIELENKKAYYDLIAPKYISWDFYKQYINIEPSFGQLGLIVFLRTYSRFVTELNRREKWCEVVLRVVEFSLNLDNVSRIENKKKEAKTLFKSIFNLEVFPAGRTLYTGTTNNKNGTSQFNCAYVNIDSLNAYIEMLYLLQVGSGVGFSVESKYVNKLPKFNTNIKIAHKSLNQKEKNNRFEFTVVSNKNINIELDNEFLLKDCNECNLNLKGKVSIEVGDSKEGFCTALKAFLILMTKEPIKQIEFVYDSIRPEGERIKTFGGRAAGFEPYKLMIRKIYWRMLDCDGKLDSVAAMDIANFIAEQVRVAGVRRCLPGNILVHTDKGLKPISNIEIGDRVLSGNNTYFPVIGKWNTGQKKQVKIKTVLGEFICSPEHRVAVIKNLDGDYEWKEAQHLELTDRLFYNYNQLKGTKTDFPEIDFVRKEQDHCSSEFMKPTLNTNTAWLLGQLHGDGYVGIFDRAVVDSSCYVSIACANDLPGQHTKVVNILKHEFKVNVKENHGEGCSKPRVCGKQFASYMSKFKKPKTTITVPDFILQGYSDIRASYVAGVFDADGYMCRKPQSKNNPIRVVTTVYYEFAKQIASLCFSLGVAVKIKADKKYKSRKEHWQPLFNVELLADKDVENFKNTIAKYSVRWDAYGKHQTKRVKSQNGFSVNNSILTNPSNTVKINNNYAKHLNMSWHKVEEYLGEKWYAPVPIKEITFSEETVEMYDIEVQDSNCFVAEGLLVHNSSQISLGDSTDTKFINAKKELWNYTYKSEWNPDKETDVLVDELYSKGYDLWSLESEAYKIYKVIDEKYPQYRYQDSRVMSNNSVMLYEKPTEEYMNDIMKTISVSGEPGFINVETALNRRSDFEGLNPCAEILLRSKGVCNLTTVNLFFYVQNNNIDWVKLEVGIKLAVRMASRITNVNMWHPEWDKVQKEDRLLGISFTGIGDTITSLSWNLDDLEKLFKFAKNIARTEADKYHEYLHIPKAKLALTIKPEGTISQLPTVSSGIHLGYAPLVQRSIRISSNDPLAKALFDLGVEIVPENGNVDLESANTWVMKFPVKYPTTIKSVDESALNQLERYKCSMEKYVEHNCSITVTVANHEWNDVSKWILNDDNWQYFVGVAFMGRSDASEGDDGSIPNLPYATIKQSTYDKLETKTPKLNEEEMIELISKYETEQEEYELESTCSTGLCPLR